ncbi:MAG: hypothetical protein MRZ79_19080 [Bacteroidia bacterium]|nr:hypothetical protein [Bacteroidia bacterium]
MKWFRRKKENTDAKRSPQWVDIDGKSLAEGDEVEVLRYDMGFCTVIKNEDGLAYKSETTGKVVSCWYMVDAATTHQKVKKLS